jgi:hypothetical protein
MARSYKKIAELQSEQIYDNHSIIKKTFSPYLNNGLGPPINHFGPQRNMHDGWSDSQRDVHINAFRIGCVIWLCKDKWCRLENKIRAVCTNG